MTRTIALSALIALFLAPAVAAPHRVTLDPAASELTFTLDTTLHTVHGHLGLTAGEIEFDLATGRAAGELLVDAVGAETGNRKRDAKMHGTVLESGLFPAFVFHAERVEGEIGPDGSGEVRLVGTLDIHGGSHPFTLSAAVSVDGDRIEAHAEFEIPYVEWGMEDPSLFLIRAAKTVDVAVDARGRFETQMASLDSDSAP